MNAIKSLGTTRALITCAVQFNSLFLRTMAGLGKWLPIESISIITSVEFFLNFLFELPFGIYADRKGRLRFVIGGLSVIILSVVLTGLATLLNGNSPLPLLYFVGALIGIGKPMYSGALEAYYQNFVRKFHNQDHKDSFLLSNLYGKYFGVAPSRPDHLAGSFLFHLPPELPRG